MKWRFAAGQATGVAHEKLAKPCQDRFFCGTQDAHASLLAIVCDGAGTAQLAHVGAEIAVHTLTHMAQLALRAGRQDLHEVLREGTMLAHERLVEEARTRQVAPRDLACTLLAVVLTATHGAALQIGDGVIVVNGRNGWQCVFWPQKGEYANTTFFLSDERALENAAVTALDHDVQDVALMSDGVEALALNFADRVAHAPFFRSVFKPLHALEGHGELTELSSGLTTWLGSPAVRARTDDDATLLLATRSGTGSQIT